jgi:hypothetical protein
MQVQQRRWVARAIKLGLVGLAFIVVVAWLHEKRRGDGPPNRGQRIESIRRESRIGGVRIQRQPPAVEAMAAGDLRIYNRDSTVNLILQGDRILAGLSPKTIEKVRRDMGSADDSGFAGTIAQAVKKTVASSMGAHVVYPVRDIQSIDYRDGHLVITNRDGSTSSLFGSVRTNGEEAGKTFSPEDAQRFVEAVRARQKALERGEF